MKNKIFKGCVAALGLAFAGISSAADAQSYGFGTYTAAVLANGVITHSSGVVSVTKNNPNIFTITFSRDISTCVYVASVTSATVGFAKGTVSSTNHNVLAVRTYTNDGTASPLAFDVIESCGA